VRMAAEIRYPGERRRRFDLPRAKTAFKHKLGLGQVGRPSDAGKGKDARGISELRNANPKFFIENSRLGIPVIFHEECWTAMRLESFRCDTTGRN
jgi:hypothetical protein